MIHFSDTILSTTFDLRAVKYSVHRVMGHKETLNRRLIYESRCISNKMSGVSVNVFPFTPFYSLINTLIYWHTFCVLLESSTLSVPT